MLWRAREYQGARSALRRLEQGTRPRAEPALPATGAHAATCKSAGLGSRGFSSGVLMGLVLRV